VARARVGPKVGPGLITLDTSALLPLIFKRDPQHERVQAAVAVQRSPYLVPAGILAEIGYLTNRQGGRRELGLFLDDLATGALTYECGDGDLSRIRDLVKRYEDLPLSVTDAAVVACAERNGGRVLALDSDFGVVANEGTISVLP